MKGNPVQSGGVAIGSVQGIRITDDGQAEVTLKLDKEKAPLRVGTRARIRQFSQSGIANRYVDLDYPSNSSTQTIPEGGRLPVSSTTTQVDLDQLFNTLDPPTRKALQGFFKGSANQFRGKGALANKGFEYLNPALSTSRRLFGELNRDTPVLERFLVDSSRLVTALAEKRDDLSGLVGNLNTTTRALANQKQALADSISLLPPVMRRANTTFVNLHAALDDTDPLVDASKPVARRLSPFLSDARKLTADAEPAIKDLRVAIRRRGRNNDLIELVNSVPPLARIAVDRGKRFLRPGGTRYDVGVDSGAFPEARRAFRQSSPIIADGRPYTTDLFGWFDDFSTTGPGFVLGDVSGHGRDALAHTAFLRYTLRAYLEAGLEPRAALRLAGQVVDDLGGDFATVILAVHDPDDGSLTYSAAGHPPPVVVGPSRFDPVHAVSSPPVGAGLETGRRQTTVPLEPGSVVCLHTDGLTEARTEEGGIMGRGRICDLLDRLGRDATASQLLETVAADAARTEDDMAACLLAPTAEVAAGGFRSEQLELSADDLDAGLAERFLEACGVPATYVASTVEEARGEASRAGATILKVRFGMRGPQAEVLPANVESLGAAARRARSATAV